MVMNFLANLHIFLSHVNLTTVNNLLLKGHVIYVSMYARKFCRVIRVKESWLIKKGKLH